jgi:hypothetical protein
MPMHILSQFSSVGQRHCVLISLCFANHKDGNLNFFTEELFEADLPIADWAKHWITIFSNFDENDRKVLEHTLLQKHR